MRYLQYGSDKYGQPIKILNTSRRYEGYTLDGSTVSGTTPTTAPTTADVSEVTLWGVLAVFTLLFILTTFWK